MDFNSTLQDFFSTPFELLRGYSAPMIGWGARLKEAMENAGLNMTDLSRRSGVPYDNLNKYLRGDVAQPRGDTLNKLATTLGVEVLWLRDGISKSAPTAENSAKDLPIYGYVKAGTEGFFMDNGEPQGYTERPDFLIGNRLAYAVRVRDKSMEPVFKHDCIVWVDPTRSTAPGDDVVIQLHDGQAFIKQHTRQTRDDLICFQHNPPQEVRYPIIEVAQVHLVVGSLRIRT